MSAIFANGQTIVIATRGTGSVHLLSYQSNGGIPNHVGTTTTTNDGVTRFIISHSYTFERFAFYWDGTGEAVYGIGAGLQRSPVGTSWDAASAVSWGQAAVTTANVTSFVSSAVVRDNKITCFIIPDEI